MSSKCPLVPMHYNVVIRPDPIEEKTAGGIILPTSATDRDKLAVQEGEIVALSVHAFSYADWPEGARKPQVGDRVLFAKYAGALHKIGDEDFRIIKDDSLVAVIETAPSLAAVA